MEGMDALKKAIKVTRLSAIITAVVCIPMFFVLSYALFVKKQISEIAIAGQVIAYILLVLMLVVGIYALIKSLTGFGSRHPLIIALNNPDKEIISKIKYQAAYYRRRTIHQLAFSRSKGRPIVLTVAKDDIPIIIGLFENNLPGIEVNYPE